MNTIRLHAFLIFVTGILVFTIGLSSSDIVGFESRFYLFALNMWRHGLTWFPTTYGHPYPDYPGTSTWLIYAFAKLFGTMNKCVAVLPSAIAAAVTLMMTYLIGALHFKRLGWAAVLFLLFTVTFFAEARTISLDQFTTAITISCFYLTYSAKITEKNQKMLWVYLLFILGFAFRGPIGLVIPAGVICIFYLIEKDVKRFVTTGIIAFILLVVCSAILLFLAFHVGGKTFLFDVLQMEVVGRMKDVKSLPFYFYFQESLGAYAVSYPLALFVLIGLFYQKATLKEKKLIMLLAGWAIVVMLGLSIPADKKVRYILSASPSFALIASFLFYDAVQHKFTDTLRNLFIWFCFYLPLLCIFILFFIHRRYPDLLFSYQELIIYFGVLQVLMLLSLHFQHIIFSLGVVTFVSSYILVFEPLNLKINSSKQFIEEVENIRLSQHAKLVFYKQDPDALPIKYVVDMPEEEQPLFIQDQRYLSSLTGPIFIVTVKEHANEILQLKNMHLLKQGKLGHDPVQVFNRVEH